MTTRTRTSAARGKWNLDALDQRYDVLIVANGSPPPKLLFEAASRRCGKIMALDGGANALRRWGIAPRHVVGDLDSITRPALEWARQKRAVIHALPSQETSDMQKGLNLCSSIGFRSALIAAADSNVLDHVLNALSVISSSALRVSLITPSVVVHVLRGKTTQSRRIDSRYPFSWLGWPSADECTLKGAVWSFERQKLEIGGFNSVSNQSDGKVVTVKQGSGVSLFIIHLVPKKSPSVIVIG